jgi:hypothetical protein
MHGEVHGHEVEAGGGGDCVGMPAEEEDRDVVVPVQELKEGGRGLGRVGGRGSHKCKALSQGATNFRHNSQAVRSRRWRERETSDRALTCSLLLRKTIKTVSTNSGTLLKIKSMTHKPHAPSPYVSAGCRQIVSWKREREGEKEKAGVNVVAHSTLHWHQTFTGGRRTKRRKMKERECFNKGSDGGREGGRYLP